MPVERNIHSPSSNTKSRRAGNAAAWSVAATKKRPNPSRLPLTCRRSVAQSSLDWWQIGCTLGAGASIYAEANCSHGRWQRCSPRSKFEHLGQGHCSLLADVHCLHAHVRQVEL